MINRVTAMSFFSSTEGIRIAIRYSVINESTGEIIESNKRADRVVVDANAINSYNNLIEYAQSVIDVQ